MMLCTGTPGEIDRLLRIGMRIDAVDHYGRTLLHLAAAAGETDVVYHLLRRSPQLVRVRNPLDGSTALHAACEGGHIETVALLLQSGGSAVARDSRGRTPVECAAAYGHHACVGLFLTLSFTTD
uniref:Ankyrin repeat protein n=1 Tax=Strombidinopsis acuminata TaxID=141414 RepID=A0A7S3WY31_9SPIT|mmetsp:Transcript_17720/g.53503  ORF Transcript_17720/g.53503 Transcript_17720/m.53503 type:complete len:124 (+) Transcript_17720:43-414(+)|eukprot:scaffold120983_cov35-Tisochrysis_lutea.AAC.1